MLGSGCAGTATPDSGTPGYPPNIGKPSTTSRTATVDSAVIERFVDFLANLGGPNTGENAALLYAEDLHFSDALMVTRDKETVVDHFTRLGNAGTRVDVEIHQTLQSDKDVYLIWSMQAYFTPIRKEVTSDTLALLMCADKPDESYCIRTFGIADLVSTRISLCWVQGLGLSDGALLQINDNRLTFHCTVAHACRGTTLVTFLT